MRSDRPTDRRADKTKLIGAFRDCARTNNRNINVIKHYVHAVQQTQSVSIIRGGRRVENLELYWNKISAYIVHTPTNALFIKLVKSLKFTLKYTIISLLHVSVFNDHHQRALSVPN